MASAIEKEKTKATNKMIYIIIGSVFYVFSVLCLLHVDAMQRVERRLGFMEALSMAPGRIITRPMEIFPLSGKALLYILFGTGLCVAAALMLLSERAMKKHDNPDTVNGEAHWMTKTELLAYSKKYAAPFGEKSIDGEKNMIFSKDIRLAIDGFATRRNCNVLVIGGSGAGKSRFYVSPNLLQFNCCYVITDPSGELLNDYGQSFRCKGYNIKVFNLTDVPRSSRYNPFHYIKEDKDVFTLVNALIQNTTPPEAHSGDPFWEKSENLLLTALILFLYHNTVEYNDPNEPIVHDINNMDRFKYAWVMDQGKDDPVPLYQNFESVMKLLSKAEVDENDPNNESELDILFKEFGKEEPENLAVTQYNKFKIGAGKTLKSILISVASRLQSFDLTDIRELTRYDEFEFEKFSDTKSVLFVVIPTADTTFNFLVSMLYTQMFSAFYRYAETTVTYGYKVSLDELTNLVVFHASSEEESAKAKAKAEAYLKEIQNGTVLVKPKDPKKDLYVLKTKGKVDKKTGKKIPGSQKVIAWRGTEEEIRQVSEMLKTAKVEKCRRRCPLHVRFILDEFANIGQLPQFDEKLATMRKYEISCSIILQALSQLKVLYKDKWNTIVANCDTALFLGNRDTETIKWLIESFGKKTTTVQSMSFQANGGGSTSVNKSSLELATIDQIAMMKEDECIVVVRGVRPYYGKKYELTLHPNYKYSKDMNEKYGNFQIELSVKDMDSRKSHIQRIMEGNGNTDNGTVRQNVPQIGDLVHPPKDSVQNDEKRKIQNKLRKEAADTAKKALQDDDGFDFATEGMIMDAFTKLGIKPNSSTNDIKDVIESLFDFEEPSDVEMQYVMT